MGHVSRVSCLTRCRRRNMRVNQIAETNFTVIFRAVTDDFTRISDAPEGMAVAANAVEDLEGDALFIANIGRFHALDKKLLQVTVADIDGQRAAHAAQIAQFGVSHIIFARAANANLDDLQWPSLLRRVGGAYGGNLRLPATGKNKTQVFIDLFGPAIIVVGEGAAMPARVRIRDLTDEQLPRSETAKFAKGWTLVRLAEAEITEIANRMAG